MLAIYFFGEKNWSSFHFETLIFFGGFPNVGLNLIVSKKLNPMISINQQNFKNF
jgi:hypothetical protein